MTAWTLLLLASMLLDTPGLPGDDPVPAYLCDGDPLCQNLVQDDIQGHLLTKSEEPYIVCSVCRKIIRKLEELVGNQPTEDTITQAASRVCSRTWLLKKPCGYIMKKFIGRISKDIMDGKNARDICVDLKICDPKAGLI